MNARAIISIFRLIPRFLLLLVLFLIARCVTVVVFCVGAFWVYDGIHRGMVYYPLLQQVPVQMTVAKLENRNHRRILPDYVATGSASNIASVIEISIFEDQYRRLRRGDALEIYPLPSGGWLNRARLEESKPIFSFLGLHFSWHLPAGLLMLVGWFGLLPWLRRKQKRRDHGVPI